ncbi:MAG: alpha/beta hydrolase [Vicinamibacteraceae bacterium]
MRQRLFPIAAALLVLTLASTAIAAAIAAPQTAPPVRITPVNVERNVIYGMYSGFALLMDVHRPVTSNGYGIVFVAGSGWQAPLEYGATPLKETQVQLWGPALVAAGYTVFAVNHRAAPRFHYPAAVEDVQRAVRFIRHHAKVYGIDPDHLGGLGGSSGGHLVGLVSTLGAPGIAGDPDPVNRQPATLQTVVLRAPLVDLPKMTAVPAGLALVVSFLEVPYGDNVPTSKVLWTEASPQSHVSAKTPPTLLMHGDADDLVPYAQSAGYEAALKAASVPTKLITVPGGRHGADFGFAQPKPGWLNYPGEAVKWFDQYLIVGGGFPQKPPRAAH